MTGERQCGKRLRDIAPDHLERYLWAGRVLRGRIGSGRVLDVASGIGYGSYLLAEAGFSVDAVEISAAARAIWERHYRHPNVRFIQADALKTPLGGYDAIVSFETIEHIAEPERLIAKFDAPLVLASVPNEDVVPYTRKAFPFHKRHYTKEEFRALFNGKKKMFTQHGKWRDCAVTKGGAGRVLCMVVEK